MNTGEAENIFNVTRKAFFKCVNIFMNLNAVIFQENEASEC